MVNLMLSFDKFSNFQLVFKIKYMVWVEFVHNRQIDSYNYLSTEDIHSKTLCFILVITSIIMKVSTIF